MNQERQLDLCEVFMEMVSAYDDCTLPNFIWIDKECQQTIVLVPIFKVKFFFSSEHRFMCTIIVLTTLCLLRSIGLCVDKRVHS